MRSVRKQALFPGLCVGDFDAGRGLWYNAGISFCEVKTMHYIGNVFRLPFEACSLLLWEIRLTRQHMNAETLASRPRRFGEGAVLL